jgi:hypothetical protein
MDPGLQDINAEDFEASFCRVASSNRCIRLTENARITSGNSSLEGIETVEQSIFAG